MEAHRHNTSKPWVSDLKPRRFVYASTRPSAAAKLHSHFTGTLQPHRRDDCSSTHGVSFGKGASAFEYQWVHWRQSVQDEGLDRARFMRIADFESYLMRAHGNYTLANANNWDHYMDNHAGVWIDNCDPVEAQLRDNGVDYFVIPHFKFLKAVVVVSTQPALCTRPAARATTMAGTGSRPLDRIGTFVSKAPHGRCRPSRHLPPYISRWRRLLRNQRACRRPTATATTSTTARLRTVRRGRTRQGHAPTSLTTRRSPRRAQREQRDVEGQVNTGLYNSVQYRGVKDVNLL